MLRHPPSSVSVTHYQMYWSSSPSEVHHLLRERPHVIKYSVEIQFHTCFPPREFFWDFSLPGSHRLSFPLWHRAAP